MFARAHCGKIGRELDTQMQLTATPVLPARMDRVDTSVHCYASVQELNLPKASSWEGPAWTIAAELGHGEPPVAEIVVAVDAIAVTVAANSVCSCVAGSTDPSCVPLAAACI